MINTVVTLLVKKLIINKPADLDSSALSVSNTTTITPGSGKNARLNNPANSFGEVITLNAGEVTLYSSSDLTIAADALADSLSVTCAGGKTININKITTEKVNDEELKHAKRVLKEQILSSLEMNGGKTEAISDTAKSPYGVTYINKQFDLIDSITPDDILYTAQNIFKNKPIISVAATKESLDANQEYLNGIK